MSDKKTYDILDEILKGNLGPEKIRNLKREMNESPDFAKQIESYKELKDIILTSEVPDPGEEFFIKTKELILRKTKELNTKKAGFFSPLEVLFEFMFKKSVLATVSATLIIVTGLFLYSRINNEIDDIEYSFKNISFYERDTAYILDSEEIDALELEYTLENADINQESINDYFVNSYGNNFDYTETLREDIENLTESEFNELVEFISKS